MTTATTDKNDTTEAKAPWILQTLEPFDPVPDPAGYYDEEKEQWNERDWLTVYASGNKKHQQEN